MRTGMRSGDKRTCGKRSANHRPARSKTFIVVRPQHRRRQQDHAVRRAVAAAGANRREDGDGAAHALAQEIDRHPW